jgi:hypothetical protein
LDSIPKPNTDQTRLDQIPKEKPLPTGPLDVEIPDIICFEEDNPQDDKIPCQYSISSHIEIRNNSSQQILFYKIRTTAPEKFQVLPTFGLILPSSSSQATVKINPGNLLHTISYEKFQVLLMIAPKKLLDQTSLVSKLKDRATTSSECRVIDNVLTNKLNRLWTEFVSAGVPSESHEVKCSMNPSLLRNLSSEQMFGPVGISHEVRSHSPCSVRNRNLELKSLFNRQEEGKCDGKILHQIEKLEGCVGKMERNVVKTNLWMRRAAFVVGFVLLFTSLSFFPTGSQDPARSCQYFEGASTVKQNVQFEYIM